MPPAACELAIQRLSNRELRPGGFHGFDHRHTFMTLLEKSSDLVENWLQ